MSDQFTRMSMTAVALVWSHATLSHREDESESLRHPALVALRQMVAQGLSSVADALEREVFVEAPEAAYMRDLEKLLQTHQLEYSRNMVARYNELRTLALSLKYPT